MATIPMKITMGLTDSEYRPCYVVKPSRRGSITAANKRKALFHKWTLEQEPVGAGLTVGSHPGGQVSHTCALVEFEDGSVSLVHPDLLRFLDTEHTFNQIAWPDDEEQNDDV